MITESRLNTQFPDQDRIRRGIALLQTPPLQSAVTEEEQKLKEKFPDLRYIGPSPRQNGNVSEGYAWNFSGSKVTDPDDPTPDVDYLRYRFNFVRVEACPDTDTVVIKGQEVAEVIPSSQTEVPSAVHYAFEHPGVDSYILEVDINS